MPISAAKRAAILKYRREKRDRISVDVPKGKRAEFNELAASIGLSLAQLIQRAVEAYSVEGIPIINTSVAENAQNQLVATNDQSIEEPQKTPSNRITAADKRLLAAIDALSPESKKTLLKFLETLQG